MTFLVGGIPTPLKISVNWDDYAQYMGNMFQTTAQFWIEHAIFQKIKSFGICPISLNWWCFGIGSEVNPFCDDGYHRLVGVFNPSEKHESIGMIIPN